LHYIGILLDTVSWMHKFSESLVQCFSTAGPRPGTGPWHQLYRAARCSPESCHFS